MNVNGTVINTMMKSNYVNGNGNGCASNNISMRSVQQYEHLSKKSRLGAANDHNYNLHPATERLTSSKQQTTTTTTTNSLKGPAKDSSSELNGTTKRREEEFEFEVGAGAGAGNRRNEHECDHYESIDKSSKVGRARKMVSGNNGNNNIVAGQVHSSLQNLNNQSGAHNSRQQVASISSNGSSNNSSSNSTASNVTSDHMDDCMAAMVLMYLSCRPGEHPQPDQLNAIEAAALAGEFEARDFRNNNHRYNNNNNNNSGNNNNNNINYKQDKVQMFDRDHERGNENRIKMNGTAKMTHEATTTTTTTVTVTPTQTPPPTTGISRKASSKRNSEPIEMDTSGQHRHFKRRLFANHQREIQLNGGVPLNGLSGLELEGEELSGSTQATTTSSSRTNTSAGTTTKISCQTRERIRRLREINSLDEEEEEEEEDEDDEDDEDELDYDDEDDDEDEDDEQEQEDEDEEDNESGALFVEEESYVGLNGNIGNDFNDDDDFNEDDDDDDDDQNEAGKCILVVGTRQPKTELTRTRRRRRTTTTLNTNTMLNGKQRQSKTCKRRTNLNSSSSSSSTSTSSSKRNNNNINYNNNNSGKFKRKNGKFRENINVVDSAEDEMMFELQQVNETSDTSSSLSSSSHLNSLNSNSNSNSSSKMININNHNHHHPISLRQTNQGKITTSNQINYNNSIWTPNYEHNKIAERNGNGMSSQNNNNNNNRHNNYQSFINHKPPQLNGTANKTNGTCSPKISTTTATATTRQQQQQQTTTKHLNGFNMNNTGANSTTTNSHLGPTQSQLINGNSNNIKCNRSSNKSIVGLGPGASYGSSNSNNSNNSSLNLNMNNSANWGQQFERNQQQQQQLLLQTNQQPEMRLRENHPISKATQNKKGRSDTKKCRKVHGMDNKELWCTQCKWKKACTRYSD